MPTNHPHTTDRVGDGTVAERTVERQTAPVSYDDITRLTTPLPDSSFRPTEGEEKTAENPVMREPTELEALIAAGVRDAFANDGHLDGSDLGVTVEGSVATLSGSVVTDADRRRAVEITRDVPGVTDVVDELRVRLD